MTEVNDIASPEFVEEYRREGYARFDMLRLVGEAVFDRMRADYFEADACGFDFHDGGWNKPAHVQVLRYNGLRLRYPGIAAFAASPRIGEFAATLMGVDHVRLLEDEAFVKKAGKGETGWHQDLTYMPVDRRHFLTIWTAIEDVEADMGPMQYLPRSHRLGSLGRRMNYDNSRTDELSRDELRRLSAGAVHYSELMTDTDRAMVGELTTIPLKAGEAIVHDGQLIHASGPNTSDKVRRALALNIIDADAQYNGMPRSEFDDLGLKPFFPFDHPNFPVIY